jgi:hypothetical protein
VKVHDQRAPKEEIPMVNPGYSRELIKAREADVDRQVRRAALVREARMDRSHGRITAWFTARFTARAMHRGGLPERALRPSHRAMWSETIDEAAPDGVCCGRDTTAA